MPAWLFNLFLLRCPKTRARSFPKVPRTFSTPGCRPDFGGVESLVATSRDVRYPGHPGSSQAQTSGKAEELPVFKRSVAEMMVGLPGAALPGSMLRISKSLQSIPVQEKLRHYTHRCCWEGKAGTTGHSWHCGMFIRVQVAVSRHSGLTNDASGCAFIAFWIGPLYFARDEFAEFDALYFAFTEPVPTCPGHVLGKLDTHMKATAPLARSRSSMHRGDFPVQVRGIRQLERSEESNSGGFQDVALGLLGALSGLRQWSRWRRLGCKARRV